MYTSLMALTDTLSLRIKQILWKKVRHVPGLKHLAYMFLLIL